MKGRRNRIRTGPFSARWEVLPIVHASRSGSGDALRGFVGALEGSRQDAVSGKVTAVDAGCVGILALFVINDLKFIGGENKGVFRIFSDEVVDGFSLRQGNAGVFGV